LDEAIADLAAAQHGVVALCQLSATGACSQAVWRRVERRQLRVIHRGVYAAQQSALTEDGRIMAAVLAGGDAAAASHTAAARLRDLPLPARSHVDVTIPKARRNRSGIRFHHATVAPDEREMIAGIPTTTTARTILDLAAILPRHRLERVVNEAEYRRLADVVPLQALLQRYPGRRGIAALREILATATLGDDRTESELEDLFTAFLNRRHLPRPRRNLPMVIGGLRLRPDCLWPEHRLIVELDGRKAHLRRAAFESDRARDRRLLVAGWRVIRVTYRQLEVDADALERDLRALLEIAA
jgi:very-short-patch-repair endonuclease